MMDKAKVDDFVVMVKRAKTIYSEGEGGKESPKWKRKQGEEDTDSDYSPAFRREMHHADAMMLVAPLQAFQKGKQEHSIACFLNKQT